MNTPRSHPTPLRCFYFFGISSCISKVTSVSASSSIARYIEVHDKDVADFVGPKSMDYTETANLNPDAPYSFVCNSPEHTKRQGNVTLATVLYKASPPNSFLSDFHHLTFSPLLDHDCRTPDVLCRICLIFLRCSVPTATLLASRGTV